MPKMKTKSGAAKRFKSLGGGGIKRTHSHLRHILTKKTTKRKRQLRHGALLAHADEASVRQMLPGL